MIKYFCISQVDSHAQLSRVREWAQLSTHAAIPPLFRLTICLNSTTLAEDAEIHSPAAAVTPNETARTRQSVCGLHIHLEK